MKVKVKTVPTYSGNAQKLEFRFREYERRSRVVVTLNIFETPVLSVGRRIIGLHSLLARLRIRGGERGRIILGENLGR